MPLSDKWLEAIWQTIKNYNEEYKKGMSKEEIGRAFNLRIPKGDYLGEYIGYLEITKRIEHNTGLWAIGEAHQ